MLFETIQLTYLHIPSYRRPIIIWRGRFIGDGNWQLSDLKSELCEFRRNGGTFRDSAIREIRIEECCLLCVITNNFNIGSKLP